ncbi:MAG: glycoside hydrolase family 16 protein, partial [Proteobacteria bacterium]|nr:glycoside hydrolase family 16 protein [Pseudomonadota bacterium]
MKLLLLASTVLPLATVASAPQSALTAKPMALCGLELAWSDEFDEASIGDWRLEGKRWIAHTPWAGDFGDARFDNPGRYGPFSIRDGKLEITARRPKGGRWTSGLIAAADETGAGTGLREGYFETRIKMTPGPGIWPAFWLMSLKP